VAEKSGFSQMAQSAWSVFPDYAEMLPQGTWQGLSVSLAGLVGTLAVFGIAVAFGRSVSPRSKTAETGRD
jgi:hypothetical protein